MKRIEIVLIITVVVLLVIVASSAILLGRRKPTTAPALPIQVFSPSPRPSPPIPQELWEEKTSQENYAKSREGFILSKPWVLKLPLKSNNYFVSYNPDSDTLVVELYYQENSNLNKDQQLSQAKQAALNATISIGININKQKIEYLELLKKQ